MSEASNHAARIAVDLRSARRGLTGVQLGDVDQHALLHRMVTLAAELAEIVAEHDDALRPKPADVGARAVDPLIGQRVIRDDDDSDVPLTGRIVRRVDEHRVEVAWGDAQHHGHPMQTATEWLDGLAPRGPSLLSLLTEPARQTPDDPWGIGDVVRQPVSAADAAVREVRAAREGAVGATSGVRDQLFDALHEAALGQDLPDDADLATVLATVRENLERAGQCFGPDGHKAEAEAGVSVLLDVVRDRLVDALHAAGLGMDPPIWRESPLGHVLAVATAELRLQGEKRAAAATLRKALGGADGHYRLSLPELADLVVDELDRQTEKQRAVTQLQNELIGRARQALEMPDTEDPGSTLGELIDRLGVERNGMRQARADYDRVRSEAVAAMGEVDQALRMAGVDRKPDETAASAVTRLGSLLQVSLRQGEALREQVTREREHTQQHMANRDLAASARDQALDERDRSLAELRELRGQVDGGAWERMRADLTNATRDADLWSGVAVDRGQRIRALVAALRYTRGHTEDGQEHGAVRQLRGLTTAGLSAVEAGERLGRAVAHRASQTAEAETPDPGPA